MKTRSRSNDWKKESAVANGNGRNNVIQQLISGLLGVAGGVIVTYFTAVSGHSKDIVKITAQISNLQRMIEENMDHRYRSTDAAKDFELRDHRLDEHEQRIGSLEMYHRSADR